MKRLLLALFVCTLCACARSPEDLSLTPEAQTLSGHLQAATCLALQASSEEKGQLLQGMPFIDARMAPASSHAYMDDMKTVVIQRLQAEQYLHQLLPKRCPKTAQQLVFHAQSLDARTRQILDSHFVDVVSLVLAAQASSPENVRKFFEMEYAAIGIEGSPY